MDNKSIFANNLKKQMELSGKTRRDVCEALGFSYYTFSDWVNGKKYPRMDKVELLANYFGVLKSDLIEDKKEESVVSDELSDTKRQLLDLIEGLSEMEAAVLLASLKSTIGKL